MMPMRVNRFPGYEVSTERDVLNPCSPIEPIKTRIKTVIEQLGRLLKQGFYGSLVLMVSITITTLVFHGGALGIEALNRTALPLKITNASIREDSISKGIAQQVVINRTKDPDTLREEGRYQLGMMREGNRTLQTVLNSMNRFTQQMRR